MHSGASQTPRPALQFADMRIMLSILAPLIVGVAAYLTFVRGYSEPANFYWDENYHVASAQKYLNHVFFLEPHPPLGKLLIALGEDLLHANKDNSQFIGTDYAKSAPPGFSFRGYRLFPVLFAWLAALFIYGIFLEITSSPVKALLLSSLYLFDNALIVHFRGAMLDSIQFCFIVASIYLILRIRRGDSGWGTWILLGVAFAAALGTKSNAMLLSPLLLLPLLYLKRPAKCFSYLAALFVGGVVTTAAIWWQALSLAEVTNPALDHIGWYEASAGLETAIKSHDRSPKALIQFIADSLHYAVNYHSKVPRLNYCKADENGSYPLLWPIGARSINYRWERTGDTIQYLYLQANPFIWLVALFGLAGAACLAGSKLLGERSRKLPHEDLLIAAVVCYAVYLGAALSVDRVFYLYHYFIPLLLCFIAAAVLIEDLKFFPSSGGVLLQRYLCCAVVAAGSFGTYLFYMPLTYFTPITEGEFTKRSLIPLWDLFWVGRPKGNPMARPIESKKEENSKDAKKWILDLSGIRSLIVTQGWGEPHVGTTVDGNPQVVAGVRYFGGFGVHAISSIDFPVGKGFKRFTAKAGVPDEVSGTSAAVKFQVLGDTKVLWESPVLRPGDPAVPVDVSIESVSILTLSVVPGGTGIEHDHASWLEPELIK